MRHGATSFPTNGRSGCGPRSRSFTIFIQPSSFFSCWPDRLLSFSTALAFTSRLLSRARRRFSARRRWLGWSEQLQRHSRGRDQRLPAREIRNILGHERRPRVRRFQSDQCVSEVMYEPDLAEERSGAAHQNSCLNPCLRGRQQEVTEVAVPRAQSIQSAFVSGSAGSGVKLGSDNRGQNRTLEEPRILAQPFVFFSADEADVDRGIEENRAGGKRGHFFKVGARPN